MLTKYSIATLVAMTVSAVAEERQLKFGLTSGGSSFFEPVEHGWNKECEALGIDCEYKTPNWTEFDRENHAHICVQYIREFIASGVDGIAAKCNYDKDPLVFEEAANASIPLVVFDAQPPEDEDIYGIRAYIGTDNVFMGRTMARLLKQLKPEGGTYALIEHDSITVGARVKGFKEEIEKVNANSKENHWVEVERDFTVVDNTDYMLKMHNYARLNPTAMLFLYQSPMRHENYTMFVDEHFHRGITFIGTDGSDYQLDYLSRRYVDGLVGQLPYEMGRLSAELLHELVTTGSIEEEVHGTNLVAYNLIPLELPALQVDQGLIGNLKYIGYVCFGIVAFCSLVCLAWTFKNTASVVVRAAQPFFLEVLAVGVLIMASALIPLSFDDDGYPDSLTTAESTAICMSVPWLGFTGFIVVFSALFSKTWRVNKFFHSPSAFGRVSVSVSDVLAPFAVLLTCNFTVLICWTIIDPLKYGREFEVGTDYWNREIASNGGCTSENVARYLVPLGVINFAALALACWQAFEARDIESEFSEATYIGIAVVCIAQAFMTGFPVVAVVRDSPEAFYLVLTFLIFILSMVVLLVIFLPKMLKQRECAGMTASEQRKVMAMSIRKSSIRQSIENYTSVTGVNDGSEQNSYSSHRLAPKKLGELSTPHEVANESESKQEPERALSAVEQAAREVASAVPDETEDTSQTEDPLPTASYSSGQGALSPSVVAMESTEVLDC